MLTKEVGKKVFVQFHRGFCEGILSSVSQDSIQLDSCVFKDGDGCSTTQIALRSVLYVRRSPTIHEHLCDSSPICVNFTMTHIHGELIKKDDFWMCVKTPEFMFWVPTHSDYLESIAFQSIDHHLSSSAGEGSKRLAQLCRQRLCVTCYVKTYCGVLTHVYDDFVLLETACVVDNRGYTPYRSFDGKKSIKREETPIRGSLLVMRGMIESITGLETGYGIF